MKKHLGFFLGLSLSWILISCASVAPKNDTSQLRYTYSRLKVMDLDQMNDIMLEKSKEFKSTNDSVSLKEGLLICLSRPDEDSVVEKVMGTVKTPLEDNDLWESTIEALINESILAIQDSNRSSVDQVTYSVVLENIISEMRPDFIKQYKSPGFETRMIEKIAAAHAELNAGAKAERKLNLMRGSFTASQIAQKLLDKREEGLKANKKDQKNSDRDY